MEVTVSIKFLGLQINNYINWKKHIEEMIPELSGACYAIRQRPIHWHHTLKSIYCAYFHCIIKHGIIFWANFSNSGKIFTVQKKIISIMTDAHPRTCCRSLFKQLEILPVPCQYILSLMNFWIFETDSSIHIISTRNEYHLHRQNANLSCFQISTVCARIKIFNSVPPSVTVFQNDKAKFKAAIRKYIHTHTF